jgi:hypothetical protein
MKAIRKIEKDEELLWDYRATHAIHSVSDSS